MLFCRLWIVGLFLWVGAVQAQPANVELLSELKTLSADKIQFIWSTLDGNLLQFNDTICNSSHAVDIDCLGANIEPQTVQSIHQSVLPILPMLLPAIANLERVNPDSTVHIVFRFTARNQWRALLSFEFPPALPSFGAVACSKEFALSEGGEISREKWDRVLRKISDYIVPTLWSRSVFGAFLLAYEPSCDGLGLLE